MFRKLSKDALFNRPLPPSYGTAIGSASPTQWQNLAAVENKGTELTIDVQIIRLQAADAGTSALNGSLLKNKLVDAGNVPLPTAPGARNEVGLSAVRSLGSADRGWSDTNSDGLIGDDEIDVRPAIAYPRLVAATARSRFRHDVGLFNRSLQISVLIDYRGEFYKRWQYEEWRCQSSGNCAAVNDPRRRSRIRPRQRPPTAHRSARCGGTSCLTTSSSSARSRRPTRCRSASRAAGCGAARASINVVGPQPRLPVEQVPGDRPRVEQLGGKHGRREQRAHGHAAAAVHHLAREHRRSDRRPIKPCNHDREPIHDE